MAQNGFICNEMQGISCNCQNQWNIFIPSLYETGCNVLLFGGVKPFKGTPVQSLFGIIMKFKHDIRMTPRYSHGQMFLRMTLKLLNFP